MMRTLNHATVGDVIQRAFALISHRAAKLKWPSPHDYVVTLGPSMHKPRSASSGETISTSGNDAFMSVAVSLDAPLSQLKLPASLTPTPVLFHLAPTLLNISR
jgi:hypothetical protein